MAVYTVGISERNTCYCFSLFVCYSKSAIADSHIFDGFNLNENILGITLKNEYTICSEIMDSIMRQSDAYFADMPAGRIVSGLDAFYAERKNRNIPISWGVWVVVRKNRRDPTLPEFLEELHNLYP